jgi:hypothetical protein
MSARKVDFDQDCVCLSVYLATGLSLSRESGFGCQCVLMMLAPKKENFSCHE